MAEYDIISSAARMGRRSFLTLATAVASVPRADDAAAVSYEPLIVPITGPVRPPTDVEAWNVGLITAHRPHLGPAKNDARNVALGIDLMRRFGRVNVRGRYIESDGRSTGRVRDIHAYLVIGNDDDSGNLMGHLRKFGRKYDQDAVLYKGYYRDAEIHVLRDLPDLGLNDKDRKSLGRFQLNRVAAYYALIAKRSSRAVPLDMQSLDLGPDGRDWHGDKWEDIGFWSVLGFFSRVERRLRFEEVRK